MKEIPIFNELYPNRKYILLIPEDYKKIPLPYFKEWTFALESGLYNQGHSILCQIDEDFVCYCCLGVLSKIQGLLTEKGDCDDKIFYLSEKNPNYPLLYGTGQFPSGITLDSPGIHSLADLNDCGFSFLEISKVIKEIWCEEELDKAV